MQYTNNDTQEVIEACEIVDIVETFDSYSLSLPLLGKTVGFPKQGIDYIPQIGDFYIDKGEITDSIIVNAADFENKYTVA